MVEIRKRDILDHDTLAIGPFGRNCSFYVVNISSTKDIANDKLPPLFDELFTLVDIDSVKPIHFITLFSFDNVPAALSHIRAGRHLGKIIISNQ